MINASIRLKIAVGFGFSLIMFLIISLTLYWNLRQVDSDSAWVTHTLKVQQQVDEFALQLANAEADVRAYILVQNQNLKIGEVTALNLAKAGINNLASLTTDNPHQQNRLNLLYPLLASREGELNELLQLRDGSPGIDAEKVNALMNEGIKTQAKIDQIMRDIGDEESQLLIERQSRAAQTENETYSTIWFGGGLSAVVMGIVAWAVARGITYPLSALGEGAARVGNGDYSHRVPVLWSDEVGKLAELFNRMAAQVEERQKVLAEEEWLKAGLNRFSPIFQGKRRLDFVCEGVAVELADAVEASCLVVYVVQTAVDGSQRLEYQAGYACRPPVLFIEKSEGIVGQVLAHPKRIVIDDVPEDYVRISSASGEARAKQIIVEPVVFEGHLKAVVELVMLKPMTSAQLRFLAQFAESFGIVLNTIEATSLTEILLIKSQELAKSLQEQREQLRGKNALLEEQAGQLRSSEALLQEQQEELRQSNEELEQANEEMRQTNEEMEEKVDLLAEQKKEMERFNRELELARQALEERASELARTSQFKSEFLTNMSHELRTPLNSLLILSKILSDNESGNLTAKQVQYAKTIYSSGDDLLQLINDILDLSKIESGSVEVEIAEAPIPEVTAFVEQTFRHVAEAKGISFQITVEEATPAVVQTDLRKVQQILKNLVSNAVKFTANGSVELTIGSTTSGWRIPNATLDGADVVLRFTVRDTGIGVPEEKQQLIFEAFQQGEAGINRTFGGTGLGLSISRQLAELLGGSIGLTSHPGQGSTFTLYLPQYSNPEKRLVKRSAKPSMPIMSTIRKELLGTPVTAEITAAAETDAEIISDNLADDRGNIVAGDRVLLIIEDDIRFANIMVEFAHEKQFKAVVARSVTRGITLAKQLLPTAISLDLQLPDNDGWLVLDQLKHDPKTRHIPIHVISAGQERDRSLRMGALSYFQKPVTREMMQDALSRTIDFINRPIKNLLIVEDDPNQRESLIALIGNGDVKTIAVGSAADAFQALEKIHFDCMVLDLGLPDSSGIEFIKKVQQLYGLKAPPIIVYTGRELNRDDETELRKIAESIVIKNIRSPERLLDETALFLHRVQTKLPDTQRRIIENVQKTASVLAGRKILVVDDDVRNIFAITSALESAFMVVRFAESGEAGIEVLKSEPDIEAVLMDVMMPGMDGLEAIRRIRDLEQFRRLPIISVTAKAMRGDREKCIEAGASDYIMKPVDLEKLKSLLRVWLYK